MKEDILLDKLVNVMYEKYVPDQLKQNDEQKWISRITTEKIIRNSFGMLINKIERLEKELEETKKFVKEPRNL